MNLTLTCLSLSFLLYKTGLVISARKYVCTGKMWLGKVVHVCNPSSWGGRDWEDCGLRPT
jgi:hypothetical protein